MSNPVYALHSDVLRAVATRTAPNGHHGSDIWSCMHETPTIIEHYGPCFGCCVAATAAVVAMGDLPAASRDLPVEVPVTSVAEGVLAALTVYHPDHPGAVVLRRALAATLCGSGAGN